MVKRLHATVLQAAYFSHLFYSVLLETQRNCAIPLALIILDHTDLYL